MLSYGAFTSLQYPAEAVAPFPITDGLRTVYDFSDTNSYPGTGTTVYDISGNGNNGELHGGSSYVSDYGGGFDVSYNTSDGLWMSGNNCQATQELTIIYAWDPGASVNPRQYGRMWSGTTRTTPNGSGGYNAVTLEIYSGNKRFYQDRWNTSRTDTGVTATTGVQILANTLYGDTNDANEADWALYKNGSSVASGTSGGSTFSVFNDYLILGNRGDWNGENVPGNYFMCHIFDRVLSASEITTWYDFYKSRFSLS
jgi:hypothetical protein